MKTRGVSFSAVKERSPSEEQAEGPAADNPSGPGDSGVICLASDDWPSFPGTGGRWVPARSEPYRDPVTGDYLMVVEVRNGPDGEEWRMVRAVLVADVEEKSS